MRAVRFDHYGGIDVLEVRTVDDPVPGSGQVLVRVKAAAINPGEVKIREGLLHSRFPATFPSGEGSDLAGVVAEGGSVGDEVIGWVDTRSSHAELVVVESDHLTRRPPGVAWEVAGSLFVVGTTAYAAVRAVSLSPGDVVVVSGAAGGVGSVTVQLAARAGATVIGLASERNHEWLEAHRVIPVTYGDGAADRIRDRAAGGVDAFIDLIGEGYVELALELGVPPDRIDTVADFAAVEKHGVKSQGSAFAATADVLGELAALIDEGQLEIPIARVFALDDVREAYRELEQHHTHGKIVLVP